MINFSTIILYVKDGHTSAPNIFYLLYQETISQSERHVPFGLAWMRYLDHQLAMARWYG